MTRASPCTGAPRRQHQGRDQNSELLFLPSSPRPAIDAARRLVSVPAGQWLDAEHLVHANVISTEEGYRTRGGEKIDIAAGSGAPRIASTRDPR